MGRKGTVRKDLPASCPHCGRSIRPCNIDRHVIARHPEHRAAVERERIRRMLRD